VLTLSSIEAICVSLVGVYANTCCIKDWPLSQELYQLINQDKERNLSKETLTTEVRELSDFIFLCYEKFHFFLLVLLPSVSNKSLDAKMEGKSVRPSADEVNTTSISCVHCSPIVCYYSRCHQLTDIDTLQLMKEEAHLLVVLHQPHLIHQLALSSAPAQ